MHSWLLGSQMMGRLGRWPNHTWWACPGKLGSQGFLFVSQMSPEGRGMEVALIPGNPTPLPFRFTSPTSLSLSSRCRLTFPPRFPARALPSLPVPPALRWLPPAPKTKVQGSGVQPRSAWRRDSCRRRLVIRDSVGRLGTQIRISFTLSLPFGLFVCCRPR
jgi:hypothetical protein